MLFHRVRPALEQQGVAWAVAGGFAVGVRSQPRFTNDLDLVVAVPGDVEADALVWALRRQGLTAFALLEHQASGRLATARLRATDGVVVDVIFASTGLEAELVRDATLLTVLGQPNVPVVRLGHLIAMKLLSESDRRLKDRVDLQTLFGFCDATELRRAAEGVALITLRNGHRGKDLPALLRQWTQQERPDLLEHLP
ncbi:MAG: nucleotidyl transferase AbiEii/AbiGii toxin family protein [Myxococcales bacterium]|nr:nucleotidyl transferase AbiEii/AbiGii toxin family protein [Myxococcales bacterium]